jgi:hypothetical protein
MEPPTRPATSRITHTPTLTRPGHEPAPWAGLLQLSPRFKGAPSARQAGLLRPGSCGYAVWYRGLHMKALSGAGASRRKRQRWRGVSP